MRNLEQIGCGYRDNELGCTMKDPKVNKAKLGCVSWLHWEDGPGFDVIKRRSELNKSIAHFKNQSK